MSSQAYAATDEEEELAIALAISASLAEDHHHAKDNGKHREHTPRPAPPAANSTPGPRGSSPVPPTGSTNNQGWAAWLPSVLRPPAENGLQRPAPSPAVPAARPAAAGGNTCAGCNGWLVGGYINALGSKWHKQCFCCAGCKRPIAETTFSVSSEDRQPYHPSCYRELHHPRCHVCGGFIQERSAGQIEFREHPFWRERYCNEHEKDGTRRCSACSRMQRKGDQWILLQDGRDLCGDCMCSIVVDTPDVQPLYNEVLEFFRRQGLAHQYRAPLLLVDNAALNDYTRREGGRADGPVLHVRGLCLADVYTSVPSIVSALRRANSYEVGSVAVPVTRARCNVTAILVLYGLPRLLTGCIIAHELTHAYLRMRSVTGLDAQVEEGCCQLVALLWLDSQDVSGSCSKDGQADQARLASYLAYQIRTDTSLVYGEGFRVAFEAFQNVGLKRVLESVVNTGRLPM